MNTKEIDQFIRGDRASCGIFQGVFSLDTLSDKLRLLICNTDTSSKPSSHWIAVVIDAKGRGECFDSFGRKPSALFEDYMNKNCTHWTFNARQLKSVVSSYCGFYCCFVPSDIEVSTWHASSKFSPETPVSTIQSCAASFVTMVPY
jgi:hypothetical protein